MKFVTASQMRELDRRTIEEHGTPGQVLMGRAGRGLARLLRDDLTARGQPRGAVLFIAGKGNNGGDAFVAARLLQEAGCTVMVWLTGRQDEYRGDALWALETMRRTGLEPQERPEAKDWNTETADLPLVDLVVDGLLGTGTSGVPRGTAGAAVHVINTLGRATRVTAIDLPTGLDADSGEPAEVCVRADQTVTLGLPKTGFLNPAAWEMTGSIEVVDIGIPDEYIAAIESKGPELITAADAAAVYPRRQRSAHKGTYGRALLIGGSRGLTGAIGMAARTTSRAGAGLVTVLTPDPLVPVVAEITPEAMVSGGSETPEGTLDFAALESWYAKLSQFDAVLAGPGIGRHPEVRRIAERLLHEVTVPMVLDADALSVFAGEAEALQQARGPLVITPHPGELAVLTGQTVADIQADRLARARDAAQRTGAVVILKGAGTVVADPGGTAYINLNGNPGMASGGTGDVLAGLLVGLLAQGMAPLQAAGAAVYLHGRAGDLAATAGSEAALVAGDVIERVPAVMQGLGRD